MNNIDEIVDVKTDIDKNKDSMEREEFDSAVQELKPAISEYLKNTLA